MDKLRTRPVARVDWPDAERPKDGMMYSLETKDIPVWLMCREDSMKFSFMKSRLHPGTDPKEAQLILICPLCGKKDSGPQLRIPGDKKTFEWEALSEPMPVPFSDAPGEAVQSVVITIQEPLGCPECGGFFKVTENVLHKA